MLSRFLRGPLRGVIIASLLVINMLLTSLGLLVIAFFQWIIPLPVWRRYCHQLMHVGIVPLWTTGNFAIMKLAAPLDFSVTGSGHLATHHWYAIVANHQSWLDILVLYVAFNRKIPMLKFFMKEELKWQLPFAGITCWVLGFPFMKRHSKSYLKKHPEKMGEDLATTRKKCEKFRYEPTTIVNFLEGTRFTTAKSLAQASPYQHLLKPKAAGLALALYAIPHLNNLLDCTIIYSSPSFSLWDFMCGRVPRIELHYQIHEIPADLRGDYFADSLFRKSFQRWLNTLWQKKDEFLTQHLPKK